MESLVNFGIKAQKYLPGFVTEKFTKDICSIIGKSTRRADKIRYAKTYKIDWKTARKCKNLNSLESCVDKFDTLNEFFARKISSKLTKPELTGLKDIISPAESYVRVEDSKKGFNIKGAKYSLKTLLDRTNVPKKATIYIFRLAPEQYHRFHSPTASIITSINEVGGGYKSVNPILLDSEPVLQTNYRKIIDFKNGLIMVTVGATCVGSVSLNIKKGDRVKHGQDLGYFEFGGSCIVLVVPMEIDKSNNKITEDETLIGPGKWVVTHK